MFNSLYSDWFMFIDFLLIGTWWHQLHQTNIWTRSLSYPFFLYTYLSFSEFLSFVLCLVWRPVLVIYSCSGVHCPRRNTSSRRTNYKLFLQRSKVHFSQQPWQRIFVVVNCDGRKSVFILAMCMSRLYCVKCDRNCNPLNVFWIWIRNCFKMSIFQLRKCSISVSHIDFL